MKKAWAIQILLWSLAVLGLARQPAAAQDGPAQTGSAPPFDDWLVPGDESVGLRIRIDAMLPDGRPATDVRVQQQFAIYAPDGQEGRFEVAGNRIIAELTDPSRSGSLRITAAADQFVQDVRLDPDKLRQFALTGLTIQLEPARTCGCRIVDRQRQPVEDALVYFDGRPGVRTGPDGIATTLIPASKTVIQGCTAIGPAGLVGRWPLDVVNEGDALPDCLLETGLRQTIRFLDQDDQPLAGIDVQPQRVGQGNRGYPTGGFPAFTEMGGDIEFAWAPGLPDENARFQIKDNNWYATGNDRTRALWTVRVANLNRQRITGELKLPDSVPGGILVKLVSFDHPGESRADLISVYCDQDGQFAADVIPDAKYCVFVQDPQLASNYLVDVLAGGEGSEKNTPPNTPRLTVNPGIPIRVVCTRGADGEAATDLEIRMTSRHQFPIAVDHTGVAGPHRNLKTDSLGVVEAFVPVGDLRIELWDPQTQNKLMVKEMVIRDNEQYNVTLALDE